jgi:hypothetical protein
MKNELVTKYEYSQAKRKVRQYEEQQQVKIERFAAGDVNLLEVLSCRPKHVLINHNNHEWTHEDEKIVYVSDVVNLINKTGNVWELLKFRGLGRMAYEEIMQIVRPFL